MKFFFDNMFSPAIPEALQVLLTEHRFTHLRTKFSGSTKDPVWIKSLGKEGGWIVITADLKIMKSPQNKQAWLEAGLLTFFMHSGFSNSLPHKQMSIICAWWDGIEAKAKKGWKVGMKKGEKRLIGYQIPPKGQNTMKEVLL